MFDLPTLTKCTMSNEMPPYGVHEFWNTEACGSHFVGEKRGSREFFCKYREFRYDSEWHIPLLVPFSETRGKAVLEIGCGNGADGTLFAQAGAIYTGVDLTNAAVEATRQHFEALGLKGNFQIEHAEDLSFPDECFDFVYSYGVLHHTANPNQAFSEVWRVLKPGGKAVLMLYHRHSFNYYIRIMGYMRLRLLWHVLSRAGRLQKDRDHLSTALKGLRGNQGPSVWQVHYENFLRTGFSYLKSENFVHHATDGPECPFAYVFDRGDAQRVFGKFAKVETRTAHFPLRKYTSGVPRSIEQWLAAWMGWYLFFYLTK